MTNQQIAASRFSAFDAEMMAFTFGAWATMSDVAARDSAVEDIHNKHGVKHGWMTVNGQGFNHETAFPDRHFPRFAADQGTND